MSASHSISELFNVHVEFVTAEASSFNLSNEAVEVLDGIEAETRSDFCPNFLSL